MTTGAVTDLMCIIEVRYRIWQGSPDYLTVTDYQNINLEGNDIFCFLTRACESSPGVLAHSLALK